MDKRQLTHYSCLHSNKCCLIELINIINNHMGQNERQKVSELNLRHGEQSVMEHSQLLLTSDGKDAIPLQ